MIFFEKHTREAEAARVTNPCARFSFLNHGLIIHDRVILFLSSIFKHFFL